MNILCIGDGDFSFSLALARVLLAEGDIDQCNSTIVTTSYESLPALEDIYGKERLWCTIHEVESLGVKVCYDVDATDLQKTLPLYNEGFFHRIVWNFPCTAVENGQDGQNKEMERNKELIRKFVTSASCMLHAACGEIHIAHKTKPPFDKWKIEEEVTRCSLLSTSPSKVKENSEDVSTLDPHDNDRTHMIYCGRIVFDRCCFPPYIPRKAKHSKSFTYHDACIYVFALKPNYTAAASLYPPTIPTSFCEQDNTSGDLLPVTKEMIQRLRYVHLRNSSRRKKGRKKQKK
jgi:25S rRNA (uracil2634-N3)-methyltransferase